MYAVVNTGGKQAKVEVGSTIAIEQLKDEVGAMVSLPVIFIADGDTIMATSAALTGAAVTAEVLEHFKGEKQIVFKFHKRKRYSRTKGHRQHLTAVRITDISAAGGAKPAKAEKVEKPAKAEKPAKVEKAEESAVAAPGICAATKADGTPCQNKVKEGSLYCGVHAKKYEA